MNINALNFLRYSFVMYIYVLPASYMTLQKTIITFLSSLVLTTQSFGQSLKLFETKLYEEKYTLCDLLTKYVGKNRDFKLYHFDSSFYSVSFYEEKYSKWGGWSFVLRNDSINQYNYSTDSAPINSEWFSKLHKLADSAIHVFTIKFGKPAKYSINKNNFYKRDKKYLPGAILKAMWVIDGQKLKVDFAIDGEHDDNSYSLRIDRFKDYYGNVLLPSWWDGF